jgi:D-glycero-D-manno-heptose 1,7-bisphosphate phosphatase
MSGAGAVFVDRDGVLLRDEGILERAAALDVLPDAALAIRAAKSAGLRVIVVTNQAVVARGIATEEEVRELHARLGNELAAAGATVDAFFFCPHHPKATVPAYRVLCDCRKPRPGMLLSAASAWSIDLTKSFMVGDRLSDVAAGQRAGCRTALVTSGRHEDPPIESPDSLENVVPDVVAESLLAALRGLGCIG